MKIISVVGARPNFMKVAPLHRAFEKAGLESLIVHTGQHYDERMSDVFFRQLGMPKPDRYLGIGSGSHAEQTSKVMIAFEEVVIEENPDCVLVVGDVNSTLACSLVATKRHIPVIHVEAGLRSGDRRMPEEVNRIVTDSISDYLFVTEQSGIDNLRAEGVSDERVFFVGNVMIDSLVTFIDRARQIGMIESLGLSNDGYVLMTMHRPSNVDSPEGLEKLVSTVEAIGEHHNIVFPMHPRTRSNINKFGFEERLSGLSCVQILDPLGYLEFLDLMSNAGVVVTDSGGIQEETTYLGVPCITLRENTERPVTIDLGTNELMDLEPERVSARVVERMASRKEIGTPPPLWDGHAADRIAEIVLSLNLSDAPSGTVLA